MVLHALRFFERFAEHTGGRTASFTRVGYLLGVDDRLRVPMEKSVALQQSVGIDSRLITPAEMREIEPRLRVDDFVAGCYEPEAGYADPSQTTHGLAAVARERGARILEQAEVLDGFRRLSCEQLDFYRALIRFNHAVQTAGTLGARRHLRIG